MAPSQVHTTAWKAIHGNCYYLVSSSSFSVAEAEPAQWDAGCRLSWPSHTYLKFLCVAIFARFVFLSHALDMGHEGLQALLDRHVPSLLHSATNSTTCSLIKGTITRKSASLLSVFIRPFFISGRMVTWSKMAAPIEAPRISLGSEKGRGLEHAVFLCVREKAERSLLHYSIEGNMCSFLPFTDIHLTFSQ